MQIFLLYLKWCGKPIVTIQLNLMMSHNTTKPFLYFIKSKMRITYKSGYKCCSIKKVQVFLRPSPSHYLTYFMCAICLSPLFQRCPIWSCFTSFPETLIPFSSFSIYDSVTLHNFSSFKPINFPFPENHYGCSSVISTHQILMWHYAE